MPLSAQTVTASPASLTFSALQNGPVVSQQLTISISGGIGFSIFSNAPAGQPWLKVNGNIGATLASSPASVTVTADPTGFNLGGPFQSSLFVFPAGSSTPTSIPVTLTVGPIGANPPSVTFPPYTIGQTAVPTPQSITLLGSGGYTASATTATGGSWLSVTPNTGTAPGAVTATLVSSVVLGLAAGNYQGSITITPVSVNAPVVIPVTLSVLPTPPVTVDPQTMVFNVQSSGTNNPAAQPLTITTTPGQSLNYVLQGTVASGVPNWLTVNQGPGFTDPTSGTAQGSIGYSVNSLAVGTTYKGSIIVATPGGTPTQTTIPVTLNYTANQMLNVPTNTLMFTYQYGAATTPAAKTVNITATSGTLSYAVSKSANSDWLSVPNAGTSGTPLSVSVNPAGLTPGNYTATVNVTPATQGSTAQSFQVVLNVTNNPTIATNVSSLSYPFQIGQPAPQDQSITITSFTGVPLSYTASASTTTCGSGWLLLNASSGSITGTTPNSISVRVVTTGFTTGPCNGSVSIAATVASTGAPAANSPLVIPVTVVVSTTPQLVPTPASISFTVPAGAPSPSPQTIALTSTSSAAADVLNYHITDVTGTANGITWLFAGPTSGTTTGGNVITLNVLSSTLPAGLYTGSVTIAGTNQANAAVANSPVVIPVTLLVTSGSLTVSPSSLNFSYTLGGAAPATQTVTIGSTGQALVYSAIATSSPTAPWLSVSPSSGNTSSSGTLTVTVDSTKFTTAGTYTGSIAVTSPGAGNSPATITVTVTVAPGTISAPTTTLNFSQVAGGAAPQAQSVAVTGTPGALNFTVSVVTVTGGNWLTVTPASGSTPATLSVSANGANLGAGTYNGTVTLTSTGSNGSPINIPVVLTVLQPATLTPNPTSLSFSYTSGLAVPTSQSLVINSNTSGTPFTVTTQYSAAGSWLVVSPTQGTAPATLSVSVQPSTLAAGTYNASVVISSPNLVTNLTIPVTLTVISIPKPVVASVGNAASYFTGGVSPGENIVIFGTGCGPATLAKNAPVNGVYGSTVGNTRVLFDGVPAPIYYASDGQTSVWVPYGVSGRTVTDIVVEYAGVQSVGTQYNVVPAAPGIYTLNQAGTGPGAILNQDGITVNGPNTPEKRGNFIAVYMTGEGQTQPPGVDGAIIPAVQSALKQPVLPVTATIGGIQVTPVYAGSAPGQVSGLMQVNLQIPANAPTGGAVPIVISVGTASSQAQVTVAIQ
jgi:uncharacterized protein (TIGR03437 family)